MAGQWKKVQFLSIIFHIRGVYAKNFPQQKVVVAQLPEGGKGPRLCGIRTAQNYHFVFTSPPSETKKEMDNRPTLAKKEKKDHKERIYRAMVWAVHKVEIFNRFC